MKRLLIILATTGATVALAACGSSGSSESSGAAAGGSAETVAVMQIDGVGDVLVDSSGRALYSPDEEASGTILCTDACAQIWTPLAAEGTPTAASGVVQLGVVDRPDGSKQVTADGKPLYTFAQDSPGQLNGNNVSDDFGSQHFTWRAIMADGTAATGTPDSGTDRGGYGGY